MHGQILVEALRAHANKTPDKPFVHLATRQEPSSLTFCELIEEASRFACLYAAYGLQPGEIILVSLRTSRDLIAAFFGAMFAGGVPSMMPFPSPKQDSELFWSSHNELFQKLGSGLIVTYPENIEAIARNIEPGVVRAISSTEAQAYAAGGAVPPLPRLRSDLACLQHSSGTTGLKKGIPLTFGAISNQIESYSRTIGISADDTIASWLPLYHDMGLVACLLMPAMLGATVVMLDPFEWTMAPVALFQAIARHEARYVWLPNFAFNHLVNTIPDDRDRVDLGHVRALINCSEPCKPQSFDRFAARFAGWGIRKEQLQICYAMAEAVFAVTQTPLDEPPKIASPDAARQPDRPFDDPRSRYLSAGRPIPGVDIRIYGPDGVPMSDGQVGEIAVAGEFIFTGYHNHPPHGFDEFRDGFYLTGDMGFLRDDELYVLGRRQDLIIVCGKKFFAHDLEVLLEGIPGVKPGRSVALGIYNDEIGSEDVVIVSEKLHEPSVDERLIRREIRQAILKMLGLVPRKIELVGEGWLIKSTSGKISRSENLRKYLRSTAPTPKAEFLNFGAIRRDYGLHWPLVSEELPIKASLLRSLLRVALEQVPIDEDYYRSCYPDVVPALNEGLFASARHHYIEFGYFEDRFPFKINVDEEFYFRSNPDIQASVSAGLFPSAQAHFESYGYSEGRLPRPGWSLLAGG